MKQLCNQGKDKYDRLVAEVQQVLSSANKPKECNTNTAAKLITEKEYSEEKGYVRQTIKEDAEIYKEEWARVF